MQTPKTFAHASLSTDGRVLYQAPTSGIVSQLITDIIIANGTRVDTPPAPTIGQVGATGSTTYTYYIVGIDAWGNKTLPSPAGTITTGYSALSSTNYNTITLPAAGAIPGIVAYDVLKGDLVTPKSIATNVAPGSIVNDTNLTQTSYTPSLTNLTGCPVCVSLYKYPLGGSPTPQNRFAHWYPIDPGSVVDLQVNIPLAPGDVLYGKIFANTVGDTTLSTLNSVVTMLNGVEIS